MRGKLLSTLRLGLSKQAPDRKAIDYAAMRDQHAQLVQATVLLRVGSWERSLSKKLDTSFWTFFTMKSVLPFPLRPWEVHDLHPAMFWVWTDLAPPHMGWAWGGQSCPAVGLEDRLGSLSKQLLRIALGSGRFHMTLAFPTDVVPEGDQVSHDLQANQTVFSKLFIANQIF